MPEFLIVVGIIIQGIGMLEVTPAWGHMPRSDRRVHVRHRNHNRRNAPSR